MNRVVTCGVAALAVLASSCGGGGDNAAKPDTDGMRGEVARYGADGEVRLRLEGNHNIEYAGAARVGILRATDVGADVLTVGISQPLQASGWTVQEVFVTVTTVKDGEFKIQPQQVGGQAQALVNNSYIVVFRMVNGKPSDAARYEFPVKGCEVQIRKKGEEGSMKCPELAHNDGKAVSVDFTWRMTGPRQDESGKSSSTTSSAP